MQNTKNRNLQKNLLVVLLLFTAMILFVVKIINKTSSDSNLRFTLPESVIGNIDRKDKDKDEYYVIRITDDDFAVLPKTLNIYPKSLLSDKQWIDRISPLLKDLGFTGSPSEKQGVQGVLYWQKGNNYLTLDTINQTITFKGLVKFAETKLSSSTARSLVTGKILSWGLVDKNNKSEISGFVSFGQNLEPVSDVSLATIYRVTYLLTIDEFPFVDTNTLSPLCETRITYDGNLTFVSCHLLNINILNKSSIITRNYHQLVDEVKNNRGVIFEASGRNAEKFSPLPVGEIIRMEISKISLAYSLSVKKANYLPLFILEGIATYKNDNQFLFKMSLPATAD